MTDTPGTRIETDLDRIRREAFEREARALKEAALKHFKEQASSELTGLRSALKDEMKTAVTAAMSDDAVKKALGKELTDQVLGKVAADLAKQIGDRIEKEIGQAEARVVEKVRKDLLDSWTKAARKALNEGFEQARADFARDSGQPTGLKAFVRSILPSSESGGPQREEVAAAEAERTSAVEPVPPEAVGAGEAGANLGGKPQGQQQQSFFKMMSTADKVAVTVLSLVLVFAIYVIWWMVTSAPRRSGPKPSTQEPPVVDSPPPPPPAELSVTAQRIRGDWMKVITDAEDQLSPDSPLRGLYKEHPPSDQFACWFSDSAQKRLEKLARGSSSNDLQQQLEETFEPCFTRKPRLRDPMYAVFSAQATVAKTFSRYRSEWDSWCANGNEVSTPSLTSDGLAGSGTWEAMNVFLKCTGNSSELTMEPASTTPQYLYVTYLALRELQRE